MENFIDTKFKKLIEEINIKGIYDIYTNMVRTFSRLNILTQKSIEDFLTKFKYWGEISTINCNYEVFYNKASILKNNLDDYVWLYNNLQDYKSKYILYAILNNYYNFDFISLKNCMEGIYKHYFDLELLPNLKNEVFVDVGAYIGDTVKDMVDTYGNDCYDKIYCYEMCKENIEKAKINLENLKNIVYKENAVVDKEKIISYDIGKDLSATKVCVEGKKTVMGVSLDEDIKECITSIKIDIEGGEIDAINGMKNHIIKERPKLLLSVYHNNTDLFEIPKLIKKLNKDYKLYLRYYGGPIFPTEIVLVCI